MTTILEIIDTAVKVGLGASISAMASWLLASQNAMNRRTDTKIENMREIIKEFSIKTESITASMDLAGHAYFSKNYTEAREHSITACRECRAAKALANIIGNKTILEHLDEASQSVMDYYHSLNAEPTMEDLGKYEREIFSAIAKLQPEIAKSYGEPHA